MGGAGFPHRSELFRREQISGFPAQRIHFTRDEPRHAADLILYAVREAGETEVVA